MIKKVPTIILVFIIATFVSCKGDKEEDSEIAEKGKEIASEQVEREEVKIESASPINHAVAEEGEELFKTKGCIACHSIGEGRRTGPDLAGVTERRELRWIEKMILNPDEMLEKDPIARELLATYMVKMTNQNVTTEEAQAMIMYLREKDSRMGEEAEEESEQE